ncbi:MAG TPA: Smr/MutS family protein [Nitrospinota bacterium]|nr:hypothetical protein [Anaerolineaceae bacterium]HJM83574.1 Smr/MutS family protein [Nitrospinota bacterium]|tara:strand:- start:3029 stop:3493 length:465 start_codon:yes stop_codon:yes gene_type:complete
MKLGDEVYLPHLGKKGRIVTDPSKGRVRVEVGSVTIVAKLDDVEGVVAGVPKQHTLKQEKQFINTDNNLPFNSPPSELDIHGLTIEEGLNEVDRFLDKSFRSGLNKCKVVHGKGEGKLRQAIRDRLKNISYVEDYYNAPDNDGGSGVTLIILSD